MQSQFFSGTTALLLGLSAGCLSATISAIPASAQIGITGASIGVKDSSGNLLCIARVRYSLVSIDRTSKHYAIVAGTDRCRGKDGVIYDLNGHPVSDRPPQQQTSGYNGYIDCSNHYVDRNGVRHDVKGTTYYSNGQFLSLPPGVTPRDYRDCNSKTRNSLW